MSVPNSCPISVDELWWTIKIKKRKNLKQFRVRHRSRRSPNVHVISLSRRKQGFESPRERHKNQRFCAQDGKRQPDQKWKQNRTGDEPPRSLVVRALTRASIRSSIARDHRRANPKGRSANSIQIWPAAIRPPRLQAWPVVLPRPRSGDPARSRRRRLRTYGAYAAEGRLVTAVRCGRVGAEPIGCRLPGVGCCPFGHSRPLLFDPIRTCQLLTGLFTQRKENT